MSRRKSKEISSQTAAEFTLKELQNWDENREFSTENNLYSLAAKDNTLDKFDSISKIWSEIYNVDDICIVNYSYDLDYIENKSGIQGCDENQTSGLTFVNYQKNWYCLDIIDIVVNGIETNANNDLTRESWNKYFGSFY